LTAYGIRPVDLAARKLVEEFGLRLNVEETTYDARDLESITLPNGKTSFRPRPRLLEMHLDLNADGSLRDVPRVVTGLLEAAKAQLPLWNQIDVRDGTYTIIAGSRSGTEPAALLDQHVTIPLGTRKPQEHINLLTASLEAQTGVKVACCHSAANNHWLQLPLVSFEARDEPLRNALIRLLRSTPTPSSLVQRRLPDGHTVWELEKREPGAYRWSLLCQPGAGCSLNLEVIPFAAPARDRP
jgi:hypothetical protein